MPETIQNLRKAGIKVWMLTGDKQETAQSIAVHSNILQEDYPLHILESDQNPILENFNTQDKYSISF